MTSKVYEVNKFEKKKGHCCVHFQLIFVVFATITALALAGCYVFTAMEFRFFMIPGCGKPEVDPYGTSNWTPGADMVAFSCTQGHDMEWVGAGKVMMSRCIDKAWIPQPPVCVTLPLRLNCAVDQNGLRGVVSMWQEEKSDPTFIFGYLNTTSVDRGQHAVSHVIDLSRTKCEASSVTRVTMPDPIEEVDNQLEIRLNSTNILAYKKAELRVTLVFIDVPKSMTAAVVSVHQGNETVVMPTPPGWPIHEYPKIHGHEIAIPSYSANEGVEKEMPLKSTEDEKPVNTDKEPQNEKPVTIDEKVPNEDSVRLDEKTTEKQPTAADKPVKADESVKTDELVKTDEPMTADKPVKENELVKVDETMTADNPAKADEPVNEGEKEKTEQQSEKLDNQNPSNILVETQLEKPKPETENVGEEPIKSETGKEDPSSEKTKDETPQIEDGKPVQTGTEESAKSDNDPKKMEDNNKTEKQKKHSSIDTLLDFVLAFLHLN